MQGISDEAVTVYRDRLITRQMGKSNRPERTAMKKATYITAFLMLTLLIIFPLSAFAETMQPVKLPPPGTDGGKPLMQAFKRPCIFSGIQSGKTADAGIIGSSLGGMRHQPSGYGKNEPRRPPGTGRRLTSMLRRKPRFTCMITKKISCCRFWKKISGPIPANRALLNSHPST